MHKNARMQLRRALQFPFSSHNCLLDFVWCFFSLRLSRSPANKFIERVITKSMRKLRGAVVGAEVATKAITQSITLMNVDNVDVFAWMARRTWWRRRQIVYCTSVMCWRNTNFYFSKKCAPFTQTGFCVGLLHKMFRYKYWFENIVLSGQTEIGGPNKKHAEIYGHFMWIEKFRFGQNDSANGEQKTNVTVEKQTEIQSKLKANEGEWSMPFRAIWMPTSARVYSEHFCVTKRLHASS